MSILANVGKRFQMTFHKVDGTPFMGQFLSIPDTSRVSNFLSTRRYLRTGVITSVRPGDVIIANGVKFIVAEHGDGFYKGPIYKHFKLFEVTDEVKFFTTRLVTNPVSGVKEKKRDIVPITVYLCEQPKTDIEDSSKIQVQTKTCVSNVELKVDDKTDKYVVTKSDKVLGVFVLEFKRL